ncbi:hypothetical protein, partial [Labrenzia sp. DG1229]|uniref:hypothetical protein n=1 Tax=Labrenzia sp. DG1229 TaxID=681847 RepID=UPI000560F88B
MTIGAIGTIGAVGFVGGLLMGTALTPPPVVPAAFDVGFQADQVEPTTFDIYVDNVNGNDSNSGILSEANAKATLAGALAIHAPGQSIGVRNVNGTDYHEAPAIPSNITISGWGAEKPVFSGGVDLTGAIVCTGSDEARVGPRYANVYKVTGLAKTLFVDDDPFNAHLVENGTQMPIAMGRGPNPLFREIESFNLDWWDADTVNTTSVFDPDEGQNVDVIVSHQSSALAGYTEAQILQTDIRFHRAPNGADRTPVSAFDSGTNTVTFDRSGYAEAWEPKYETNVYKKRFCLVNLAAAIQKGEWAFWDNGDGTVDIYYWPMDVANVDTAIQYSDIDVVFNARNSENVTFKSLIVQNTAATQLVGADCPIRLDASVGVANIGPFTLSNIKVKNSYSKGDGYGAVFCRGHDNYLIEQCTFEDIRNAYGVFMSGGTHSDVEGRTLGGNFTRNLIRRADKSPIRVFGNANNMVTRNHAIECGLAAHANKGNHYKGGSKTLWAHNYWWACSGYWTFQEADGQDFIGNWITCHFSDGRGLVDQNRDSAPFSNATTNLVNGDFYFLNNMVAPSEAALLAASFNAMSALGNPNETHARFAAKNNITHGIQVDVESTMITGGEGNNVYTGGTKRQASDVETPYTDVFEDVVAGNYNIKPTSPTRSQTGESLVSLEGSDGAITLAARWPGYDFSKDINGDDWDLANPGVGPETVPGNGPVFAPV